MKNTDLFKINDWLTKGDEYSFFLKVENFYSWFAIFGVLVFALNAFLIEKLTATGFSKWAVSIKQ